MENPITKPYPKALSETEEMQNRIQALAELAKQREQEGQAAQSCKIVPLPLPLWPDSVRAVPNVCLRSALFGAIRKGRRRFLEQETIAAMEGVEICYTGPRLDQGDLDVYESLLHLLREQPLGNECHTTSYALLKLMGKKDTGGNRRVLQRHIERLRANAVTIKTIRFSYIGGLVDVGYKDNKTQEWIIVLNSKLKAMFAQDQYTHIEWTTRRELEGHQLAQWLHGFYTSHAQPYPVKVETLHRLCGSETERMDHFREKLRKALCAVTTACVTHGETFQYRIENDIVSVDRTPSKTQQRHIIQRTTKRTKRSLV